MDLKDYFEKTKGFGVLATANADGQVDVAVYARPHAIDENTVAFIMRDRRSYHYLKSNGQAAYLFYAEGEGYNGVRLHLSKVREETNASLIEQLSRRTNALGKENSDANRYLVYFSVDEVRPLIGEEAAYECVAKNE